MKKVIIVYLLLFLFSCDSPIINHEFYNNDYSIKIKYLDTVNNNSSDNEAWNKKFNKDSLHLTCEFYFESDSTSVEIPDSLILSITKNNKETSKRVYKKNFLMSTGYDYFNCGSIKSIQTLGIRIDNGKLALIEIDSTESIIRMGYDASKKNITIDFLKSMPFYR